MVKNKIFSILNIVLILALIFGFITKIFFIKDKLANPHPIIIALIIFGALINLLLIFGVFKQVRWVYIVVAIFALNYFKNSPSSSGYLLGFILSLSIIIISLIQYFTLYKNRKAEKKTGKK